MKRAPDPQLWMWLPDVIRWRIPGFEVRYKNDSLFMKVLGKLTFFNPGFMTQYTTTIGSKVYFPSRTEVAKNPRLYGKILAHEYVHIMADAVWNWRYKLSYMSPQIWSVGVLGVLGAFWNLWFLLCLLFLICAAPWPSPWRIYWERRAYTMNLSLNQWRYERIEHETLNWMAKVFCGWGYYKMCWTWTGANDVVKAMVDDAESDKFLKDPAVSAFYDVHKILKENV